MTPAFRARWNKFGFYWVWFAEQIPIQLNKTEHRNPKSYENETHEKYRFCFLIYCQMPAKGTNIAVLAFPIPIGIFLQGILYNECGILSPQGVNSHLLHIIFIGMRLTDADIFERERALCVLSLLSVCWRLYIFHLRPAHLHYILQKKFHNAESLTKFAQNRPLIVIKTCKKTHFTHFLEEGICLFYVSQQYLYSFVRMPLLS